MCEHTWAGCVCACDILSCDVMCAHTCMCPAQACESGTIMKRTSDVDRIDTTAAAVAAAADTSSQQPRDSTHQPMLTLRDEPEERLHLMGAPTCRPASSYSSRCCAFSVCGRDMTSAVLVSCSRRVYACPMLRMCAGLLCCAVLCLVMRCSDSCACRVVSLSSLHTAKRCNIPSAHTNMATMQTQMHPSHGSHMRPDHDTQMSASCQATHAVQIDPAPDPVMCDTLRTIHPSLHGCVAEHR